MKKFILIQILLLFMLSACVPEAVPTSTITPNPPTNTSLPPTKTNTPEPSLTYTLTPTSTVTPTVTPTPTPEPYDFHNIGFPLNPEDVIMLVANYGSTTTYGDFTHDGVDIRVAKDHRVLVLAVDSGIIIQSEWVNDAVGYEVYLNLGYDSNGERVVANYVHLDKAKLVGTVVEKGDVIGWIMQPHGGGPTGDHILYFGIRIGTRPRYEFPGDGAQGDEVDVTDILVQYLQPDKVKY